MSSTVGKLRFMQKAKESDSKSATPELSTESTEKWKLSSFDSSRVFQSAEHDSQLKTISVMARRSYGGANPYVEQVMATMTQKKRKSPK